MDLEKKKLEQEELYAQISDCYVVYLLCYSIAGHSLGALMYLNPYTLLLHQICSMCGFPLSNILISGMFILQKNICRTTNIKSYYITKSVS